MASTSASRRTRTPGSWRGGRADVLAHHDARATGRAQLDLPQVDQTDRLVLLGRRIYVIALLHRHGWVFGDLSLESAAFALNPPRLMLLHCDGAASRSDLGRQQMSAPLGPARVPASRRPGATRRRDGQLQARLGDPALPGARQGSRHGAVGASAYGPDRRGGNQPRRPRALPGSCSAALGQGNVQYVRGLSRPGPPSPRWSTPGWRQRMCRPARKHASTGKSRTQPG